ncbi:MAG: maltose ABC transporter substrate-binding protein [Trueperaceae bacterium]|nr:maltose ABC transporter substrate-binding protein [Trueperaceae bacterium]
MKKLTIALIVMLASLGVALGQGLTVWTTFGDQTLEWLQEEADSFASAFGVPVNVVKLDLGELQQQALLAAPQGEAGDLFVGIPHDQLAGLAEGGVLADMSAYATSSYLADLGEQARLAYTYAGRLFGLPMFVEGPALVINTDLVPNPPATYEEFVALAQELTTADTFGFMFDAPNFYFAYGWIHTFGGYVFGRDATGSLVADDLGVANEGAIRGAQSLKDLRFAYDLIPSGTNYDVANGLFIDGSLAMIYNGPWAISQYREAGVNVEILPVPPLADGTEFSGFMGVQGVLMNQFSSQKVDAANFAKWITRSDAQVTLARISGRIPASESALAQVSDDPIIAGYGNALLASEPMPNIPRMGQVWGPMGSALSIILETADSDVAAALESARSEIAGQ